MRSASLAEYERFGWMFWRMRRCFSKELGLPEIIVVVGSVGRGGRAMTVNMSNVDNLGCRTEGGNSDLLLPQELSC